jgi:hypothetical protein
VGPYELVVTESLVALGFSRGLASSYAIGSHLLLILWIGITGMLALWSLSLRPADLFVRRGLGSTTVDDSRE